MGDRLFGPARLWAMTGTWLVLAACGAAQETPPVAPATAAEARTPAVGGQQGRAMGQVTFPSGRVFHVVLAITPEEQARGYQERAEIPPDEGMLFVGDEPALRLFHMLNCLVPIDMIWLDGQDRVVFIEHSAPPCRAEPCPSYGPMRLTHQVLEVRGGTAREEGLTVGDTLVIATDLPRS